MGSPGNEALLSHIWLALCLGVHMPFLELVSEGGFLMGRIGHGRGISSVDAAASSELHMQSRVCR